MIGQVVGNFRILRELGSGAMGAVYEGVDVMVERPVAIKMLRAEIARQPELIERFRVEAVTLAKLSHPSIATLYSFFREDQDYYMVMEFVKGRSLEAVIRESGRLPAKAAADILCQTLDGMAHAHQLGILHRDIKPANIMITGDARVKVTDFGIARVLGSSRMTREGRIIGTLEYIAPERIRGEETDARSDLYSAGIVLYEALAGRLPFTAGTDFGLMQAHLSEAPPPMVAVGVNCPPELEAVLVRSLAKSAADRYQSAGQFREAIVAAMSSRAPKTAAAAMKPTRLAEQPAPVLAPARLASDPAPASAVPSRTPVPPRPATGPARTPWFAIGAGLGTLLLGGMATIWYFTRPDPQRAATSLSPGVVARQQAPAQGIPQAPAPSASRPVEVPLEIPQTMEPLRPAPRELEIAKPAPRPAAPANPPAEKPSSIPSTSATPPAAVDSPPAEVPRDATAAPAPVVPSRAVRSIRDVRKLYIERMPADLKQYVVQEISRQLYGRMAVTPRRDEADGIMTGRQESSEGLGSKVTGGYLGMKDSTNATATITDVNKTLVLWSSQAGDKKPILGMVRRGGVKKVAERLVTSLRQAVED